MYFVEFFIFFDELFQIVARITCLLLAGVEDNLDREKGVPLFECSLYIFELIERK